MKAITEERLRELCKKYSFINHLISECEEIDTLTVSKLRPMCDAPSAESFMVKLNTEEELHEGYFMPDGNVRIGTVTFRIDYCEGWVPKTIYKPELTGDGE